MEGKLIKTENGYSLKDCELIAFVSSRRPEHKHRKLSLTNCQAIERGYDLDELAIESSREYFIKPIESPIFTFGYEEGFQKALELMGDKKFSDIDVKRAMRMIFDWSEGEDDHSECTSLNELWDKYFESTQQTEWDVTFDPEEKDAEGRLILKRK